MSEQEFDTPETAADVWERTVSNPNPITKEAVRGNDPNPEAPVIPDRVLVTGQLEELYATKEPAADPVMEKLAALEDSLVPRQEPENPAVYNEIQKLRAEIARRDQEAAEAAAAEELEARKRTIKEGFIASIDDTDDFPAIKASGFAEKVFDQLDAAQQSGEPVSEEELLSKTEAELWGLYEALHTLKSSTTSEETPASEAPQTSTPTLTPSLTAADSPVDVESVYEATKGDRRAAAAELWNNIVNR